MTREESLVLLTRPQTAAPANRLRQRRLLDAVALRALQALQWFVILLLVAVGVTLAVRSLPIIQRVGVAGNCSVARSGIRWPGHLAWRPSLPAASP
jgi:ABC-type phosphate transport system permease subunit